MKTKKKMTLYGIEELGNIKEKSLTTIKRLTEDRIAWVFG